MVGIDNGFGAACAVARILAVPMPTDSPGSTASPASPATWPSAACSTPAPTSSRCTQLLDRLPVARLGARGRARAARRHGGAPTSRCGPTTTASSAPTPTSPGSSRRPACPTACATGPWPPSPRWPRSRGACTAARRPRCTSTRSAASTPSSTSSARAPPSRCSASTSVRASPVATGTGMVRAAHGVLPNPAPAVVELLRGAPTYGRDAADRAHHPDRRGACWPRWSSGFGPLPPMTIAATGFGAGTARARRAAQRDPGRDRRGGRRPTERGQPLVLLEANVDDATGETLAHAVAALLDAGAHDAWITPIVMKKGRPAHTVSALADPALAGRDRRGAHRRDRHARRARHDASSAGRRPRRSSRSTSTAIPVRVKVSPGRAKAEHDDARRAAAQRLAATRGDPAGRRGLVRHPPARRRHRRRSGVTRLASAWR